MSTAAQKLEAQDMTLLRRRLRRLAARCALALVSLYVLGVIAGFSWLRYLRNVEEVGVLDVALFNLPAVHRGIAIEQFARARREWDAKNFQAAFVIYSSALRHDPSNTDGRLDAADFYLNVGAPALAQNLLSDGLTLDPGEPRLIKRTFELLVRSGRDKEALRLLRELYPKGYPASNALDLQTYEVFATLTSEGPQAAGQVLGRYPQLVSHPAALPVLASVSWENGERPKAIDLLSEFARLPEAAYADFQRLAGWQRSEGHIDEAIKTAGLACSRFPEEVPPRVLLLEMQAANAPDGMPAPESVEAFLRENGRKPAAIERLASLAGAKGWVELARMLYELGVLRSGNLPHLALCFSDAMMSRKRFAETGPLLAGIESQMPDDDLRLAIQLRQRQVVAAAAVGDSNAVREYSRRLGAAVGNNPEALDMCRRLFSKLGIADAVDELTPRAAKPATVADNG